MTAESDFFGQELRWFQEHRLELEATHPGEWVAIGPDGLISVGADLADVLDEAKSKGFPDALAMGVRARDYLGSMRIGTAGVRVSLASEP
jgi:hypothetical protein